MTAETGGSGLRPLLAAEGHAGAPSAAGSDGRDALRLWLRLLTAANVIEGELRRRLHRRFGFTLARFDLMAQLERAGGELSMGELSRRMMVTNGNVTGLAEQLVRGGLARRATDPDDRRVGRISLTPEGRALFAEMARAHEDWVAELVGGLAPAERAMLHDHLGALKRHALSVAASREAEE